ncbi:P-loop NTPase family protein [Tessaracoccus caeni]|uniref:ABC transporter n=1 Tax=Tessaracoccus caeni TaxID=3031239 RepID=UPI0023D9BB86|nr:ABC transporter [Tessaracoccus caeni]MDF1487781.1 ABC transporter [Tessaracoccus caeni]
MTAGSGLGAALRRLDEVLPLAQFPLPLADAQALRDESVALGHQLRDYLLPRADRVDAPLLAVVGGSTGAGKSTLVNSILRAPVTRPGVLRPTTKSPVLVCHPDDAEWFRSGPVLPELVRTDVPMHDSRALQIVASEALPSGLALLDAPDIDSVDDANRALARQLLSAADLWLFVTSAARYADAVPWEYLELGAERRVSLAIIVNRCPLGAMDEISAHLAQLLGEKGLGGAQLWAVPERRLGSDGMLQSGDVEAIRSWLIALGEAEQRRSAVTLQTLAGSVRSLEGRVTGLAEGVRDQLSAVEQLRQQAAGAFLEAAETVERATGDGTMLRGEILARWQDIVGTSDLMRGVEEALSSIRSRIGRWFHAEPQTQAVQVAITDGLADVLADAGESGCEEAVRQWSRSPWGRAIVSALPELGRPSPSFRADAAKTIRQWQSDVLRLVDDEGAGKRLKARLLALGTNLLGAALIIVVFASTGGLTGAEVGIAGGTAVLAQRLLEAVFGTGAVAKLAERAKSDLDDRVQALMAVELARFEAVLNEISPQPTAPDALAQVADELSRAALDVYDELTRPEVG